MCEFSGKFVAFSAAKFFFFRILFLKYVRIEKETDENWKSKIDSLLEPKFIYAERLDQILLRGLKLSGLNRPH